jgi:tRNA threonylcarbamoyladenosine biosynthesis protein TsaE
MASDAADQLVPPLTDATLTREELVRFGEALGAGLRPPAFVSIAGELGSGKTTLVQAICRGYGVQEAVTSPTFALVHEYQAPRSPVFHLDLYRLAGPADLTNIGWDDIVGSDAVVLVEWPERAAERLPADRLRVALAHVEGDDQRRRVTVA